MTTLTPQSAKRVLNLYSEFYFDSDRVTEEEFAALKAGLTPEEAAFAEEWHGAISPDDDVTADDVDRFRAVPVHFRHELREKFLGRFHHAWIRRFAPTLDAKPGDPFLESERIYLTYAHLGLLVAAGLPDDVTDFIRHYQVLFRLRLAQAGLKDLRDMMRERLAPSLIRQSESLNELRTEIVRTFGTAEQKRELIPVWKRETRRIKREAASWIREEAKNYRTFCRAIREYRHGRMDPDAVEAALDRGLNTLSSREE